MQRSTYTCNVQRDGMKNLYKLTVDCGATVHQRNYIDRLTFLHDIPIISDHYDEFYRYVIRDNMVTIYNNDNVLGIVGYFDLVSGEVANMSRRESVNSSDECVRTIVCYPYRSYLITSRGIYSLPDCKLLHKVVVNDVKIVIKHGKYFFIEYNYITLAGMSRPTIMRLAYNGNMLINPHIGDDLHVIGDILCVKLNGKLYQCHDDLTVAYISNNSLPLRPIARILGYPSSVFIIMMDQQTTAYEFINVTYNPSIVVNGLHDVDVICNK